MKQKRYQKLDSIKMYWYLLLEDIVIRGNASTTVKKNNCKSNVKCLQYLTMQVICTQENWNYRPRNKTIKSNVLSYKRFAFFISSTGGTSNTFLSNLILAKVRSSGNMALTVASSGICNYKQWKTTYFAFKLHFNVFVQQNICSVHTVHCKKPLIC